MKINESYLNPTSQCHGYHESLDNKDTKTEKEPVKREQKQEISPMSTFTSSKIGANIIGIAVVAGVMVGSVALFHTYSSGVSRDIQEVRTELQDDIQHLEIELKNDIQHLEIELKNEIKKENRNVNARFDSIEKLLYILIEDKISNPEDSPPPKEETEQ